MRLVPRAGAFRLRPIGAGGLLCVLALAVALPAAPAVGGQIIDTVVKRYESPSQGLATDMYLDLGSSGSSRHGQGKFDADGNFVFAESGRHVIRKLDTTTGMLTTIAGTGDFGLSGDGGPATQATLNFPNDVAIEPFTGDIYISDSVNNCIRMIRKTTGVIIRIGGDGVTRGDTGDGGAVINATFDRPRGMGFDSARNLYICNSDKNTIRKITYDAGLDPEQRIITRVAGGGASTLDGVVALNTAALSYPFGLHVTPGGDLYIGGWGNGNPSEGHRIRKVDVATGLINTVAGQWNRGDNANGVTPATAALMRETRGVVLDGNNNIYIADQINNRIRKVDATTGTISTFVGTGVSGYSGDSGAATAAQINYPHGVAFGPGGTLGVLFIMDQNHTIRKVNLDTNIITTVAGKGPLPPAINGPAFIAKAPAPDGRMYFSNLGGHTVMRYDPSTGATAVVAGTGTAGSTGDGGLATAATLNGPTGVAFDAAGNLYIAESSGATGHRVRKVDAATGIISTLVNSAGGSGAAGVDGELASTAKLNTPRGMAFDSAGDLYIADQGNNRIRKVSMSAVPPTVSSYWTGLNSPRDIVFDTRLATRDDLYCADLGNHAVKMKAWVGGAVTTVAGGNGQGFGGDGGLPTAPAAKLSNPYGVTLDPTGGYLYIGDYSNTRVRRVDLAPGGFISTFAGDGDTANLHDGGPPANAGLSLVMGLAFDANSYLYICDYGNSRIRRVTPSDESDLSVGLSATPLALAVGATSTATVTLQNSGLVRANATVTITLPAGLSLQSASTTQGTFDTGTLVWTPGNVCVWAAPTLTLVLEGVADGTGDVTAELTTSDRTDPDSTPGNNVPAEDDQASVSVEVSGGDGSTLYWHPEGASANGNLATNWTTKQAGLVRVVAVNATHHLSFGGTGTNADNDCTLEAGLTCASIDSTGYAGAFSTANFDVTTGTLTWPAGTFNAGSSTVTVTGTGTPLTAGGTINVGSSTFKYAGSGDQAVASVNYHNLDVNTSGGAKATSAFALTPTNIGGTLSITGAGILDLNAGLDLTGRSLTFSGAGGELRVAGDITDLGTFTKGNGKVTMDGGGAHTIGSAVGPAFHDLTITNSTAVLLNVNATVDATTLVVDAGSSLEVAGAITLTLLGGASLDGGLELNADSVLATGGDISIASTGSFTVSGTSAEDGYATISNNGSGTYAMTLDGAVDVQYAHIDNLSDAGVTLDGNSTATNFKGVVFGAGASSSVRYLLVEGADWDGYTFLGLAFPEVGGGGSTIEIPFAGTVNVVGYATGAGYRSGDVTDIELNGGSVDWAPTAAEGLTASAGRVAKGVEVCWSALSERGTVGYAILRRTVPAGAPNAQPATRPSTTSLGALSSPKGNPQPGTWKKLAEVPAAAFGGEPTGSEYRWLDDSVSGDARFEYRVEEIEAGRASTSPARADARVDI